MLDKRLMDEQIGEKIRLAFESGGGARKWYPGVYHIRDFTKFVSSQFSNRRGELIGLELGVFTGCNAETL